MKEEDAELEDEQEEDVGDAGDADLQAEQQNNPRFPPVGGACQPSSSVGGGALHDRQRDARVYG